MTSVIVVAVDGSPSSQRAVEWCAAHAEALDAEVVAVHAIDLPALAVPSTMFVVPYVVTEQQRADIEDMVVNEWCAPLERAHVPFRGVVREGQAAQVVTEVAKDEDAALVVTGSRGRGGFAGLLLGSTSSQLAHHLHRPLLIVP